MKSLHEPATYQECVERINKLTAQTPPLWGKMTVGQMLAHCSEVVEVYNGEKELKPNLFGRLLKGMIRKAVVGEKPYSHNSPTAPQFVVKASKEFEPQRSRLLAGLYKFHNEDQAAGAERVHPLFGKMTPQERGWSMYKHTDHHLRQFGV